MSKLLVTGAGGLVGTALCDHLLSQGHEVVGLVRTTPSCTPSYSLVYGDLLTDSLPPLPQVDSVVHLAWAGSMGPAREDFPLQASNVVASVRAVEWAKTCGAKHFVGVGTITEAELSQAAFAPGKTPGPGFVYGLMKDTARNATRYRAAHLGLTHSWARLGNTYFPGDTTGRFLISMVEKFVRQEARVTCSEGLQPYDFVAMDDAVAALTAVATEGRDGGLYYVGSGKVAPLRSFIETAAQEAGYRGELSFGAPAPVVLPKEAFSIATLQQDTSYCPQVPFERGIASVIAAVKW